VGVPYAQVETFPDDAGWQPAEDPRRLVFSRRLEPRQLVNRLLRRDWSWTWRLSDSQIIEAAESLQSTLAQRFGCLDSSVEVETGFWVRVYRPPSV
jgi:hypothetical protein